MQVIHLSSQDRLPKSNQILALGFFDGLHSAHRSLLQTTVDIATKAQLIPAMMTFSTHILSFLKKETFHYLTSLEDKILIAESMGFEVFYVLDVTTSLTSLEPSAFIDQFLTSMKEIVVGFDFTYGKRGLGNVYMLQQYQEFKTTIIGELTYYNKKVGSTRIREAIKDGKITLANHLLGRPYQMIGEVIKGKGRGTNLGFPTANLSYCCYLLPKSGVYIATVYLEGQRLNALVNVGDNPTFEDKEVSLEAYIMDFTGKIYGKKLTIQFIKFLRDEIKYTNIIDLIDQMKEDERIARLYLERTSI
jgi:riboflavin kinase/FMN adenylyltransferase